MNTTTTPEGSAVTADVGLPVFPDQSPLTEMTHQAMLARWREGLVTPMSSTINTFAKTDGSWWTANQNIWLRVQQADRNDRLDYHHSSFGSVNQAKGPATSISPWCAADD
jgi:hypothetical protein